MSESVKITIEAEDKASAKLIATAKIYKDNISRSIQLNYEAMTAEERHAASVRQFQADLVKGIINRDTYNRLIEQSISKNKIETDSIRAARIEVERYAKSQQLRNEAMKRFASKGAGSSESSGIGSAMALAGKYSGALSVGFLVKQSLELAAGTETARVAFEVLTGSAEKASNMIQEMKGLDAKSPLSFSDIQLAGKTLLGYGVTAEQVMPSLKRLGDISMGSGDRFKSLALAFGQVQASGRLMGQEVLQMVNNGFNPLQEISKNTGKSMVVLKKEMEDGKISAQMVTDALASATKQGGRFFGMTERMSQTASGAYAKMVSDLQKVGIEFGEKLIPAATQFARLISSSTTIMKPLSPIVETIANGWGAIAALLSGDISKYMKEYSENKRLAAIETQSTTTELSKQVEHQKKLNTLTAEQYKAKDEKTKLQGFSSERNEFQGLLKEIDEEYRRKMLGEEKYREMKILTSLRSTEMINGEQQARDEAFRKIADIQMMDRNAKAKKDKEKLDEDSRKKAEGDFERIQQLKKTELDKLREEQILLTKGKEAAHAFNLEKQGMSRSDAMWVARQQANLDRLKDKDKKDKNQVDMTLTAFSSRLLTRGPVTDESSKLTAMHTGQGAATLKNIEAQLKRQNDRQKGLRVRVIGS